MVLFYIVAFLGFFFFGGSGRFLSSPKFLLYSYTQMIVSIAADSNYPSWLSELSNSERECDSGLILQADPTICLKASSNSDLAFFPKTP